MVHFKILTLLKDCTVEPVLFFGQMSMSISQVVEQVGLYRVVCQQIYESKPEISCGRLANTTVDGVPAEYAVQERMAMWNMVIGFSYLIPGLIAGVFLGAYGDRNGRKVNMLLGMFGLMLSLYSFVVIFTYPLDIPLYILVLVHVVAGLTGFFYITSISANAYLADTVLDPELLTIRMSIMTVIMSLSSIIGALIAGISSLTPAQGILTAQAILAGGFLICMLRVRHILPAHARQVLIETQQKSDLVLMSPLEKPAEPEPPSGHPAPTKESVFALVCNLLRETWRTYARPREGHVRLYLLIAAFAFFLSNIAEGVRDTILVLYVQKEPLSWNQDMIGHYRAVQSAMSMIGTTAGIFIFKKLLKFTDTFIIIISSFSHFVEILLLAFATTTWMVYTSAVISSLAILLLPCIQSFMAKQVAHDEVGKAFTAFGISANIGLLVSSSVYNPIYAATVSFFPGFVFLFASVLQGTALFGVIWLHFDSNLKMQTVGLNMKQKILNSLFVPQEVPSPDRNTREQPSERTIEKF